jgi:hypothetical protein
MLRVGWARVSAGNTDPLYKDAESVARSARYGMWATFVLDMDEWRKRASDKTLLRQPISDYKLLLTRQLDISPPFGDFCQRPKRFDR